MYTGRYGLVYNTLSQDAYTTCVTIYRRFQCYIVQRTTTLQWMSNTLKGVSKSSPSKTTSGMFKHFRHRSLANQNQW